MQWRCPVWYPGPDIKRTKTRKWLDGPEWFHCSQPPFLTRKIRRKVDLEEWFSNLAAHWDHLGISKTLEKNWCLVLSSRESDWSGVWLERTSQAALVVKDLPADADGHNRCCFDPWVGKIPWRRAWQPTPVFLPGEFYGQRSLLGYSPWGCKELDVTEWLHFWPQVSSSTFWRPTPY